MTKDYIIRFKNEIIKERLESMAKEEGKSLNEYLNELIEGYVTSWDFLGRKHISDLENTFDKIFKKTEFLKDSLEQKLKQKLKPKIPHPTEIKNFKDLIFDFFPNPTKREIFYLKFIQSQIHTELELLYLLLTMKDFVVQRDLETIINYCDYFIEKDNIKEKNIEEIKNKFISDFYKAWFLQLYFHKVIKDTFDFELSIPNLERFIFTYMYPDLKTKPIFNSEDYNNLQQKWIRIIELIPSEEPIQNREFNLKNIYQIKKLLKILMLNLVNSFGLTLREFKILQETKEFRRSKIGKELNLFEKIYTDVENIKKEFYRTKLNIAIIEKAPTNFQKKDFSFSLAQFFDDMLKSFYNDFSLSYIFEALLEDYPSEESTIIFTYLRYITFKPFIIDKILELDNYFEYLKKKDAIINFFPSI